MIDTSIFIKTLLATVFIFFSLGLMITLKFKYRHSYINILCLGGLLWLFACLFFVFDLTTFNLINYDYYGLLSKYLFVAGFGLIFSTLMIIKILYKDKLRSVFKKTDFKNIFLNLEVLTIITDLKGKILLINNEALFEAIFHKDYEFFNDVIFKDLIEDTEKTKVYKNKTKSFLLMKSIIKSKSTSLGYLFSFDDISILEDQKEVLKQQNRALESMNTVLEETVDVKSKLSVEKERLNLLNRIQIDLVGHIEHIIINLEIEDDKPLEDYKKKAEQASLELRKVYKSIRQAIREMKGESNE